MPNSSRISRVPFLAFTSDSETIAILKQFAEKNGWAEAIINSGDINSAIEFLKTNKSPKVLFVDVASAETMSASLDGLADVCDPDIKVIVSGKVNEYSFYCWLMEVGISSYLLKPFNLNALEKAYSKATIDETIVSSPIPVAENKAKIISVIGARGGVGATTICVNLAWIIANHLGQKTGLLDFDPQLGTVALALDLEPSRGLRDALEKPDRIDSLFMDRVMIKIDEYLSVLSTEEALDDSIVIGESAAEALFQQVRSKFSFVIIDLPRTISPFTRYAMKNSDHVVCVSEYNIMGLRESLRYLDFCRDNLQTSLPLFIANRVGLAGKHQMPQAEFEKGLGQKIDFNIPFALDANAASISGEVFAETAKNAPATRALHSIAAHFVGEVAEKPAAKFSLFGGLFGGKK